MGFFGDLVTSMAGPLISGAFGLGGSSATNSANARAVRLQNEGNMELAKYAADRNYELWKENNEYNSPSSQLQRYKEAGLNPNLVYGGNSAAAGNSQSPSAGFTAPHLERYQRTSSPVADGVNAALNRYYQQRGLDADVRYKEAQADAAKAQAKKMISETLGQDLANQYNTDTLDYRIMSEEWKAKNAQQNFFTSLAQEGYTRKQTERVALGMLLDKATLALTNQKVLTEKQNTELSRSGVLVNYAKANNISVDTVLKRAQIDLTKAMESLTRTNAYFKGIEVGKLTEEIVKLGMDNDINRFRYNLEKMTGVKTGDNALNALVGTLRKFIGGDIPALLDNFGL